MKYILINQNLHYHLFQFKHTVLEVFDWITWQSWRFRFIREYTEIDGCVRRMYYYYYFVVRCG